MERSAANRMVVLVCVLVAGLCASVQSGIIYVDDDAVGGNDGSSWTDAYAYLQDALAVARAGDEVRVAQGLYKPDQGAGIAPGDRNATFAPPDGVTVVGGYAALAGADPNARDVDRYEAVLSGDLNEDDGLGFGNHKDNSRSGVVTFSSMGASRVLRGVTITAGQSEEGAGIRCFATDVLIEECRIVRNQAYSDGAGMVSYSGHPKLKRCVFENNRCGGNGGGLFHSGGNLSVRNCTFTGNSALYGDTTGASGGRGGAICMSISSSEQALVTDCLFRDNRAFSGGAIEGDVVALKGCRFVGNLAYDEGGVVAGGEALVCADCLFVGNRALKEVAVARRYGPLGFTNCTFADNESPDGNMILAYGGHGSPVEIAFINCIAWGGTLGVSGGYRWQSYVSVTYSDFQGGWQDDGNIDIDPGFVLSGYWDLHDTPDDANDDVWVDGDYHLRSQAGRWDPESENWVLDDVTSPCIDAGDPRAPIGFEPFPNGGIVNMGAYGGTADASKTYFGEPICAIRMAGDINGDCKVDFEDLLILVAQWTDCPPEPSEVTIVEPVDGTTLQLGPSESVLVRAVVSAPDFAAAKLRFEITHESEGGRYWGSFSARNGEDGWYYMWTWWKHTNAPVEGDYVITAMATDSSGQTEVSAPVVITVQQATSAPSR